MIEYLKEAFFFFKKYRVIALPCWRIALLKIHSLTSKSSEQSKIKS